MSQANSEAANHQGGNGGAALFVNAPNDDRRSISCSCSQGKATSAGQHNERITDDVVLGKPNAMTEEDQDQAKPGRLRPATTGPPTKSTSTPATMDDSEPNDEDKTDLEYYVTPDSKRKMMVDPSHDLIDRISMLDNSSHHRHGNKHEINHAVDNNQNEEDERALSYLSEAIQSSANQRRSEIKSKIPSPTDLGYGGDEPSASPSPFKRRRRFQRRNSFVIHRKSMGGASMDELHNSLPNLFTSPQTIPSPMQTLEAYRHARRSSIATSYGHLQSHGSSSLHGSPSLHGSSLRRSPCQDHSLHESWSHSDTESTLDLTLSASSSSMQSPSFSSMESPSTASFSRPREMSLVSLSMPHIKMGRNSRMRASAITGYLQPQPMFGNASATGDELNSGEPM